MSGDKMQEMANMFYGTSDQEKTHRPAQTEHERVADVLYDHPTSKPNKPPSNASTSDVAALFYGDSATRAKSGVYETALKPGLEYLADNLGLTQEQIETVRVQRGQFYNDLDVSPAEAPALDSLINHYQINPASPETVKEWAVESRRAVREQFGADSDRVWAEAREFCREKGITDELERTGLASHPRFTMDVIERVQRLKRR